MLNRRHSTRTALLARVTCLGLATLGGAALTLPVPSALAQTPARQDAATFDVDFAGGTVGEYFDMLSSGARVNIVAADDVRALELPAVRMRAVNSWAAVHLLESLFSFDESSQVAIADLRAPHSPGVLPPGSDSGTVEGEPVYVVSFLSRQRPGPVEIVNEVFSIADVLRPANEEAVESQVKKIFEMIDSAMGVAPGAAAPDLAYHDDSQMLVFRGTPEQRRLIESVLARYLGAWRPQSAQARDLRDEIAQTELQAKTSMIEAQAAQTRLDFARQRLDELRRMADAAVASSGEVRDATASVSDLDAQVQTMQARVQYARQRLADLQTRLAALTQGESQTVVVYDFRDLGARGDRIGAAFKSFLDAADLPDVAMQADGSGMVSLRAGPALQEALRYVLGAARQRAASDRAANGRVPQ